MAGLSIPSNDPYNSTVTVSLEGYGLPASNQPPTVTGLVAKPSSSVPLKVDFTASAHDIDGVIVKYEWDFEGDSTYDSYGTTYSRAVVVSDTCTYKTAGTYNPTIRVTDNGGAIAKNSMTIKVLPPLPDLTVSGIVYQKQTKSVSVVIKNIGNAKASRSDNNNSRAKRFDRMEYNKSNN